MQMQEEHGHGGGDSHSAVRRVDNVQLRVLELVHRVWKEFNCDQCRLTNVPGTLLPQCCSLHARSRNRLWHRSWTGEGIQVCP